MQCASLQVLTDESVCVVSGSHVAVMAGSPPPLQPCCCWVGDCPLGLSVVATAQAGATFLETGCMRACINEDISIESPQLFCLFAAGMYSAT